MRTSYIISHNNKVIASCDNIVLTAVCLNDYINSLIKELEEEEDREMRNVFPRTGERKEIEKLIKTKNYLLNEIRSIMLVGQCASKDGFSIQCVKRWDD